MVCNSGACAFVGIPVIGRYNPPKITPPENRPGSGLSVYNVCLLAEPSNEAQRLASVVDQAGLSYSICDDPDYFGDDEYDPSPEAALLDMGSLGLSQTRGLVDRCRDLKLPAVVVVPGDLADSYDPSLNPDEFIFTPVDERELLARVRQAIYRVKGPAGQQVLKVDGLVIDLEKYDVMMQGRHVPLTYKEFQLLVLLASNPGRVYTREALLSQVWGYDYLGGTRTVDVHVRRLRAKIEDPDHSFVETIWNVGYRFKSAAS